MHQPREGGEYTKERNEKKGGGKSDWEKKKKEMKKKRILNRELYPDEWCVHKEKTA